MPKVSRRTFLQFGASALATLGLKQYDIHRQGVQYAKVLAQTTSRKLALLVGINNYADAPLKGCLTDVDLQRELLIHRFGFKPSDILTVTDETSLKPTRQGIIQAFAEHLIQQAKPGDVVVFHFSGHGSQVFDPTSGFQDQLNSTFVPMDRSINLSGGKQIVSDIMGGTLFLLMSALQTDNVTAVLDSCHSGGGKRGNLIIRALEGGSSLLPSSAEQEYQDKLLTDLGLSRETFIKQRQESIAKGAVIASARRNQLAADGTFADVRAGAFTYVMTQYLWQLTGEQGLESVIANVSRSTARLSTTSQIPEYEVLKDSNLQAEPAYLIEPQTPPAEGVLKAINGDDVEIWLGGINPKSLEAFDKGAEFSFIDQQGDSIGTLKLTERQQLMGKGRLIDAKDRSLIATDKTLVQEKLRAIPENYQLLIGLEPSLGSAQEMSAAIIELNNLNRVRVVPLGEGQEVHYILGRMTTALQTELKPKFEQQDIPPLKSLGLYSEGLDIIPGSFRKADESVPEALGRLKSKFEALLAARIVKLTLNGEAARLNVTASMHIEGSQDSVLANVFAARGVTKEDSTKLSKAISSTDKITIEGGIPQLSLETPLQLQVHNQGKEDLYVTVLVIDSDGMTLIFPNNWVAEQDDTVVKAGETRRIPDLSKGDQWFLPVSEPLGATEVLFIASVSPLGDSLKFLRNVAGDERGPVALDDPIGAVDRLLGDFEEVTKQNRGLVARSRSKRAETTAMATMSITFEAIRSDRGAVQLDDPIS